MEIPLVFRIGALLALFSALGLWAFFSRRARHEGSIMLPERISRHGLIWRLVLTLPLLAVLLLDIFFPAVLNWAHFNPPLSLRIIGLALAFLSIPLLWWAFRSIGKNITPADEAEGLQQLVTSGPYSWMRHPLYSGTLLLVFSLSLVLGDWIVLGCSLAGRLFFQLLVIPEEERDLLETFGEEYEVYRARTKALMPWIR